MTAEPYTLYNNLSEWQVFLDRLRQGEIVPSDQWVDAPPIMPGVSLRSATIRRSADSETKVGGMVVGPGRDPESWLTIEARVEPSRIEYHTIRFDDVLWEEFTGILNRPFLKDLRWAINADRAKRGHESEHMAALLVLERCLS